MDVVYSPEVQKWPEDLPRLQLASNLLAEILGPVSSGLVKADWQRSDQNGHTLYRLTIRDFTGPVFTDFSRDELENPLHMRVRLYRLWGDLLQIRNNQQHHQVQIISGQVAANVGGQ